MRTLKENDQARVTHILVIAEGREGQDMEGKRPSRRHSLSGDHEGWDKSGYKKKVTEPGVLTNWRPPTGRQVRTRKEREQARGTHCLGIRGREESRHGAQKEIEKRGAHPLEIAEGKGRSSQDAERKVPSQRHSLPEHRRGRDKLRH